MDNCTYIPLHNSELLTHVDMVQFSFHISRRWRTMNSACDMHMLTIIYLTAAEPVSCTCSDSAFPAQGLKFKLGSCGIKLSTDPCHLISFLPGFYSYHSCKPHNLRFTTSNISDKCVLVTLTHLPWQTQYKDLQTGLATSVHHLMKLLVFFFYSGNEGPDSIRFFSVKGIIPVSHTAYKDSASTAFATLAAGKQ